MRMRSRATVAAALCAGLVAGVLSSAPASAQSYGQLQQSYIVPTRDGKLYLEVVHPTLDDKIVRAPMVLTVSPYSAAFGRNGDADEWVTSGYARGTADVVGTGNSGGCWDYGGNREKRTGYDLVEWVAKQKWSTGKVGMIGGSYDGTTAMATSVTDPPHLTTIVPELAISRWYEYAYSGGIRYAVNNEKLGGQGVGNGFVIDEQGFDTPLGFDFGFAVPPPSDPENAAWQERVESSTRPCDELNHTQNGYDLDTPDYDKFWLERDYVVDAAKVDIPVLVAGSWGDWNVKQENSVNFYKAIVNSPKRVLYMGSRWQSHDLPGGDYAKVVHAWMDHYLKGIDNGIDKLPAVVSQGANFEGPLDFTSGPWPKTTPVELIAQEAPKTNPSDYQWKLLPTKPGKGLGQPTAAQFPSAGINTESHANHHARSNHDWFWFETPHLKRDTRIFGEIKVQIWSTVDREWVTFTPSIVDVDPAAHQTIANQHVLDPTRTDQLVAVTRGWLDSRYRNGLEKAVPIEPGKSFGMTVVAKPQDYTFAKGHYIGLSIQTEINEWSLPKLYPCSSPDCPLVRIDWEQAKTRLILPIVNAPRNPLDLFDFGAHHDH